MKSALWLSVAALIDGFVTPRMGFAKARKGLSAVRVTALCGILSAMGDSFLGLQGAIIAHSGKSLPCFLLHRQNNFMQCFQGLGNIWDNLSRIFPG